MSGHPETGRTNAPSYVVGIGASAGGLRPLERFFEHMPATNEMAFVVVQHLSPDFKSLMQELLARHTRMPVFRADDGLELEAGHVYVLTPRKTLELDGSRIVSKDKASTDRQPHFPIDRFLSSLAETYHDRAIGVILSGTGSDGTRGLEAIHAAGGLALVQDPESAEFDGMPRTAMLSGVIDFVLPPAELARRVYEYGAGLDPAISTHPDVPEDVVTRIAGSVSEDGEVDFSMFKPATLARRIRRRRLLESFPDLDAYAEALRHSPDRRRDLRRDFLIGVTRFMRDPIAWNALRTEALPALCATLPRNQPLRLWVTACSTGEEAYSMAIVAHEALEAAGRTPDFKVFATDASQDAIERASAGYYDVSATEELPPELVEKYFVREDDRLRVTPGLRDHVLFARHDLTRDAPFTRLHVVSCRNLLIYLRPEWQDRVLKVLHFALNVGGILFLGSSESTGELDDEFEPVRPRLKIFRKRRDVRVRGIVPLTGRSPGLERAATRPDAGRSARAERSGASFDGMLEDTLGEILRERAAVCLMVSSRGELLQVFGDPTGLLRIPEGRVTSEVATLLPSSLALPVNTGLYRARDDHAPVRYRGIRIDPEELPSSVDASEARIVDLTITYHAPKPNRPEFSLVRIESPERAAPRAEDDTYHADSEAGRRIGELEHELQYTREHLQSVIEELESTNEEQQATNEELLSSNEELQSTNEELHSVNEELYTVNAEFQSKIQQLTELTHDMDNLLRSTDIGTLFLDDELRIRRFTPEATKIANVVESDVGRPITHLATTLDYPEMHEDLRTVLRTGHSRERELRLDDDAIGLLRIHPYRTDAETPQGVVLTLVDITELHDARQLAASERLLRGLATHAPVGIFLVSPGGHCIFVNDRWSAVTGIAPARALGDGWLEAVHPDDRPALRDAMSAEHEVSLEVRYLSRSGIAHRVHVRAARIVGDGGRDMGHMGLVADPTPAPTHGHLGDHHPHASLFESETIALGMLDGDARWTRASPRLAELFRLPRPVTGHPLGEGLPGAFAELRAIVSSVLEGDTSREVFDVRGNGDATVEGARVEVFAIEGRGGERHVGVAIGPK